MKNIFAAGLLLALTAMMSASGAGSALQAREKIIPAGRNVAFAIISQWPDYSRELAGIIIDEYGAPDEVEPSQLTWMASPPWRKVTVFRDPVSAQHPALLLRAVSYRVPFERWRALVAFGHGIDYDPVNEQLSARTDNEETNYLALNLADDVVRGQLSALEAAEFYDRTMSLLYAGKTTSYTTKLHFPTSSYIF
jgi:hypothetical protein